MTRDEAIEIWRNGLYPGTEKNWSGDQWAEHAVDTYAKLGILKLDEPKTPTIYDKIETAMASVRPSESAVDVRIRFQNAGLDIVVL